MHFSAFSGTEAFTTSVPSRSGFHRIAGRGEARGLLRFVRLGLVQLKTGGQLVVAYRHNREDTMKTRSQLLSCSAVLLGAAVGTPAIAAPLPTCALLDTNPAYGLAGNSQISNLTATLYAAGADGNALSHNAKPYCRVDFTLSTVCGPAGGYQVGQCQQLKIRVGLPASIADGGSGGVQGGWNGKNRDLGGGGYAGSVGAVFSSTDLGYVGSSTDTGHPASAGGSFALNPNGSPNNGLILDFVRNGIHEQHIWGDTTRADLLWLIARPQILDGMLDGRPPRPLSGAEFPQ
jgi:hypothetical protein